MNSTFRFVPLKSLLTARTRKLVEGGQVGNEDETTYSVNRGSILAGRNVTGRFEKYEQITFLRAVGVAYTGKQYH